MSYYMGLVVYMVHRIENRNDHPKWEEYKLMFHFIQKTADYRLRIYLNDYHVPYESSHPNSLIITFLTEGTSANFFLDAKTKTYHTWDTAKETSSLADATKDFNDPNQEYPLIANE